MSLAPTPRPEIYDIYWQFAANRHAAFENRMAGRPAPWSNDEILQNYKFCNVFRAADRVSQYLIEHVAYRENAGTKADMVFQILAFRTFSKIETWEGVIQHLGRAPTLNDLTRGTFEKALDDVKKKNNGLYTGAFILCATKEFGFNEKHKNYVVLFKKIFLENNGAEKILAAGSLKQVVEFLQSFPLIGPFMAYQIAIDLNYSTLIHFDENDYTQAGPGALRGIQKIFSDTGSYTPAEIIHNMVERQEEEFSRLNLRFNGLWGRPLHAIDCQNLFCEVDKYCRKAAPELVSNRTRIKTKFKPSSKPLPLFFPPKWGLVLK